MKYVILFTYDLVLIVGYLFYLPVLFYRKKVDYFSLKQKAGFIKKYEIKDSIWLQVVSVGEVNLISSLIDNLVSLYPKNPLVVSTTTLSGYKLAQEKYSRVAKIIYFPLDVSLIVRKVIDILNPKLFIAVETEIWPHAFYYLKQKNVPIIIINGRISNRAFKRYEFIRTVMKKVLSVCSYIGVQSQSYKELFLALGAPEERTIVSGNLKFSSIKVKEKSISYTHKDILPLIKKDGQFLLVAGSTHPLEENLLLEIIAKIPYEIKVVIAPRHLTRIKEIENAIKYKGLIPVRLSSILKHNQKSEKDIYILDIMGELLSYYSIADICFIGGTFSGSGGHNPLEPLYFGKPTIFGPSMENFKDIEELVLKQEAGIKVNNKDELKEAIIKVIEDKQFISDLAMKSKDIFLREGGSMQATLDMIAKCLR